MIFRLKILNFIGNIIIITLCCKFGDGLWAVPIIGGLSYECSPKGDTVIGFPVNRMPVAGGIIDFVNIETLSIIPCGNIFTFQRR